MAQIRTVTILFGDLVGSTTLLTRLGDDTFDRVRRSFFVTLREAVAAHSGEEVKTAGDGIMVAFPASAGDAVSCAVAMQRGVARLNQRDPLLGLAVRIGISSGEASHEDGDWFGLPVVEASRLEGAARPGQILVSDLVRGLVGTRRGHVFTSVGGLALKNLPEPLAASEVAWEPEPGLPSIPMPSGLDRSGPPFAGRGLELLGLQRAWDDARAGSTRVLLVAGEHGIGKTRLIAEFAAGLHSDDVIILHGRNDANREGFYQPFAEALRWYVIAARPETLREQAGPYAAEIAGLVPALATRLPDLVARAAGDRGRLHEAVASLLRAMAAQAPVLLVLDEMQAARTETLNLFAYLVEQLTDSRIFFIALATTPSGGTDDLPLSVVAGLPSARHISLRGLPPDELALLLSAAGESGLAPGLAERIHAESEGNPLFALELLARLQEAGALSGTEGDAAGAEAVLESASPYMGMRAFEPADAGLFFGREAVVASMLGRLAVNRFLAVVGASGSGKSSIVRAGIVPALAEGALPASRDWPVAIMVPGASPLAELAARLAAIDGGPPAAILSDLERDARAVDLVARQVLARTGRGSRLVLVVDQFEEVFTTTADAAERERFIDALLAAAATPGGPTVVVLSLRADFYAEAARYRPLAEALALGQVLLGPMDEDELRSAIERPAERAGLRLEPGLADRILADLGHEPGRLPLLSHALLETWRRRRGRTLTVAGYEASGGVRGAVSRTAESAYGGLDPESRDLARDLFLRLTSLGEGTEDTRRRVAVAEVAEPGEPGDPMRSVIRKLVDARLLTTGEDSVEVAHEALIREWTRLRDWLDEDREGLRALRHLTEAASAWQALGRDAGELYRGGRLEATASWVTRSGTRLNRLETEFLDSSIARQEAEERESRARVRRLRALAAGLAGLLLVALVASGVALVQWVRANDERNAADQARDESDNARREAEAARASAEAAATEAIIRRIEVEVPLVLGSDRSLAFALAAQAYRLRPGSDTTELLSDVLTDDLRFLGALWPSDGTLGNVDISPDGLMMATTTREGLVELWDLRSRERIASTTTAGGTTATVYFNADGSLLVSTSADRGTTRLTLSRVPSLLTERSLDIAGMAFAYWSPAEDVLAIVSSPPAGCCSSARFLDIATGQSWDAAGLSEIVSSSSFSRDGRLFVVGGLMTTTIMDVASGAIAQVIPEQGYNGSWLTDDGHLLLGQFARPAGRVAMWDRAAGAVVAAVTGQNALPVVRMNAERTLIAATMGSAGEIVLLDAGTLAPVGEPYDPQTTSAVSWGEFAADGSLLVTMDLEGTAELWTLAGDGLIGRQLAGVEPGRVVFSPVGDTMLVQHRDGSWTTVEVATGRAVVRSAEAAPGVAFGSPMFSPDGSFVATGFLVGCADRICPTGIAVWDSRSGRLMGPPIVGYVSGELRVQAPRLAFAISPDSSFLAFAPQDGTVEIWGVSVSGLRRRSGWLIGSPEGPVEALHFLGTGGTPTLVALAASGRLSLWEMRPTPLETGAHDYGQGLLPLAVSAEGLILVGRDSDVEAFTPGGSEVRMAGANARALMLSADGTRLAVRHGDGEITLWDAATGSRVGEGFGSRHSADDVNYALSPDGSLLVVSDADGIRVWELEAELWFAQACLAAGRNLTAAEWSEFFPDREYAATCPQWPSNRTSG